MLGRSISLCTVTMHVIYFFPVLEDLTFGDFIPVYTQFSYVPGIGNCLLNEFHNESSPKSTKQTLTVKMIEWEVPKIQT